MGTQPKFWYLRRRGVASEVDEELRLHLEMRVEELIALVRIYTDTPPFKVRFSAVDYLAFTQQQTRFEQSATYTDRPVSFSNGEIAEVLLTRVVSWAFFSLLGVQPVIGRDFAEADGGPGTPPVVLASHAFWQQRLDGRADAIGRSLRLDGADYTLVGVVPPANGPLDRRFDLFLVQQFTPPARKGPFFYSVIARLPERADRSLAASELQAINRALFPIWKSSYQDEKSTWGMEDLKANLVGDVRSIAGVSLGAVGLVWLIACANASNLLIARVTSRRQELAVRAALGASRGRIVRYLLGESVLLAGASVLVGVGFAAAGMQLLQTYGSTYFPRTAEIGIDAPVMWLMLALALSSAVLFGLVPAVHGAGGTVDAALRSSRSSTASSGVRRLRRVLVGAQFAIATPLLIVAGLLLVSLNHLKQVDLGFPTAQALTGSIRLPGAQYREPARINAFWDELKRRVEAQPGVAGVAYADNLPPNQVGQHNNFDLEEPPAGADQSQPVTPWVAVSPGYAATLGLKLIEGRLLDERDVQPNLKEISIRMALGGSRADVARLVIGQGMVVVLMGVVAGAALAVAATRLMASLLFGVGAADPRTFTAVSGLMLTMALLACAVPAWRAMRVQPATILRND